MDDPRGTLRRGIGGSPVEVIGTGLPPAVAELEAELALLRPLVAQLQEPLDKLPARLCRNSQNSSRPPSSDPPSAPPRLPSSPPAHRKPGGQPGHDGTRNTGFQEP
jgi:hypothetical protein